jgi:hypothetical protein
MASAGPDVPSLVRAAPGRAIGSRLVLPAESPAVAALAVVSWILLAAAHVADNYGVDHAIPSGTGGRP